MANPSRAFPWRSSSSPSTVVSGAHGGVGAGASPPGSASSLPPAQVAVRFGRSAAARRVQRWIVILWLVLMGLGAGLGWLLWQLPLVVAVPLVAVVGIGALAGTVALGLVVLTMRRASVAAGDGWVGYRVLGRWKVVRAATAAGYRYPGGERPDPTTADGGDAGGDRPELGSGG